MLKFYKSMTLLNTMDRILYESQRQVRGLRLALGGAGKDPRSPCLRMKEAKIVEKTLGQRNRSNNIEHLGSSYT